MKWLDGITSLMDGITDLMHMSLSKLWELMMDRKVGVLQSMGSVGKIEGRRRRGQ